MILQSAPQLKCKQKKKLFLVDIDMISALLWTYIWYATAATLVSVQIACVWKLTGFLWINIVRFLDKRASHAKYARLHVPYETVCAQEKNRIQQLNQTKVYIHVWYITLSIRSFYVNILTYIHVYERLSCTFFSAPALFSTY